MAGCDYRSCDVCGCKTFYDANVGYDDNSGKPVGVGDWAVVCEACAVEWETVCVKKKHAGASG